ncbi:hypothetical protein C0J52_02250 [Blattella germanica]|nr:hypothetical protein C0J52_02250 [Blattella germanica]
MIAGIFFLTLVGRFLLSNAARNARGDESFRLPKYAIPLTYNISMKPDLEEFSFEGRVSIEVEIQENTKRITMHSYKLNIQEVKVSGSNGTINNNFDINEKHQFLIISSENELVSGQKCVIDIIFNGTLSDDMQGFYRSSYKDKNGNIRWIAASKFQATHARKAFPCFDEPQFKAKFTIQINTPPGYHTLSNMPADNEHQEESLLFDSLTSEVRKRNIAQSVAHEIAHMWFGCLVTPKWWDDTWLKEGFARYFEYFAFNEMEESWFIMQQFVIEQQHSVFLLDSLFTSIPLSHECNSPIEIQHMFQTISHGKGWNLIIKGIHKQHRRIHVLNRAQLIDDAFNLARTGRLEYLRALTLIDYLREEEDYIPWAAGFNVFSYLDKRLARENEIKYLKEYVLLITKKIIKRLGFYERDSDSHITRMHRALVIYWVCRYDHENCVHISKTRFMELQLYGEKVPPNLESVVYCSAIKHGTQSEWDFLWNIFQRTTKSDEKKIILSALGCTENEYLIERYLSKSIDSSSSIKKQDADKVFLSVSNNPVGLEIAFEFLRKNHQKMVKNYGRMNAMADILYDLAGRFRRDEQIDRVISSY